MNDSRRVRVESSHCMVGLFLPTIETPNKATKVAKAAGVMVDICAPRAARCPGETRKSL